MSKCYLREATLEDRDIIFKWANDVLVRANAFCSHEIKYEEHCLWYEALMCDVNQKLYIFEVDEEPIGQVRLTVYGTYAEIDYSICSEFRGKGYGKQMITMLRERVKKDLSNTMCLVAKVKPENRISEKVFQNCGYLEKYRQFELNIR